MLDLKWTLNNLDTVRKVLADRNTDMSLEGLIELNEKRKALQQKFDELRALQNQKSKEIALLKKQNLDPLSVITEMQEVAAQVKNLGQEQTEIENRIRGIMLMIPNVPHESAPVGNSSAANTVVREWGSKPDFSFKPREHWELGENLHMLDFERAAKVAGARFAFYSGALAKLERALISFMLDLHTREHGYTELLCPYLVNEDSMIGTGLLPKFGEDSFKTTGGYYLIPTAEVPVTNIYRDETLRLEDLPYKFCAFTPCFRSEAGSYGKDVKGLIRQHQFHKVELVKLTTPEKSYEELEKLTLDAEQVLRHLNIAYRTVVLSTGDMGFGSAKTYDIEAWLPGQNRYREISSCSNYQDFQARRMNTRFKGADGKPQYVHTLNGSGLAVGRTLIAIMENYQQQDGSIVVPEALRGATGMDVIRQ